MVDESKPPPQPEVSEDVLKEAAKKADDPGGAHGKGYSADPPGAKPAGPPPIPFQPEDDRDR
jgi:hypothetical protein